MSEYTSPTSSPVGQPGEIPRELAVLTALETVVDAVRFRFEALDNDIVQERPAPARRSMGEIIGQMRDREERFVQFLYEIEEAPATRQAPAARGRFFMSNTAYQEDLGQFLQLRQESLAVLRRLTHDRWQEEAEVAGQGSMTVFKLARQVAEQDAADLNELADLRRILAGGSIPGTAGVVPGSGSGF